MAQYLFVFLLHYPFKLNIPCPQLSCLLFEKFPFLRKFNVYFGDFLVKLILERRLQLDSPTLLLFDLKLEFCNYLV